MSEAYQMVAFHAAAYYKLYEVMLQPADYDDCLIQWNQPPIVILSENADHSALKALYAASS